MEKLHAELGAATIPGETTRELMAEVGRLRKELGQVNALLRSAAEFHEGYGRLLRFLQNSELGYSREGATIPPPGGRKLIVHG